MLYIHEEAMQLCTATDWNALLILLVCGEALEDGNHHRLAAEIRAIAERISPTYHEEMETFRERVTRSNS